MAFYATTPELDEATGTLVVNWTGLRGDTLYFTIQKEGLANWENREWIAQLRITAADVDIYKSFDVTNNSTSSDVSVFFKIQTDDVEVGKYSYDVQWQDPDLDITTTIMRGKVVVKQDTSR